MDSKKKLQNATRITIIASCAGTSFKKEEKNDVSDDIGSFLRNNFGTQKGSCCICSSLCYCIVLHGNTCCVVMSLFILTTDNKHPMSHALVPGIVMVVPQVLLYLGC